MKATVPADRFGILVEDESAEHEFVAADQLDLAFIRGGLGLAGGNGARLVIDRFQPKFDMQLSWLAVRADPIPIEERSSGFGGRWRNCATMFSAWIGGDRSKSCCPPMPKVKRRGCNLKTGRSKFRNASTAPISFCWRVSGHR